VREWTGGRLLCATVGEVTPQADILGPKAAAGERFPTAVLGVSTGTHLLANGKGSCPLLHRPNTEQ
jgi:hypothetical protein